MRWYFIPLFPLFLHFSPISNSTILSPNAIRHLCPGHPTCIPYLQFFFLWTILSLEHTWPWPLTCTLSSPHIGPLSLLSKSVTDPFEISSWNGDFPISTLLKHRVCAWLLLPLPSGCLVKVTRLRTELWTGTMDMLGYASSTIYKIFNFIKSLYFSISLSKGQKRSYLFRVFLWGIKEAGICS